MGNRKFHKPRCENWKSKKPCFENTIHFGRSPIQQKGRRIPIHLQ